MKRQLPQIDPAGRAKVFKRKREVDWKGFGCYSNRDAESDEVGSSGNSDSPVSPDSTCESESQEEWVGNTRTQNDPA